MASMVRAEFGDSRISPIFWDRIVVLQFSNCWEYRGSKTKYGYGQISIGGRHWLAHRLTYSTFVGSVPAGLELDHLCKNRACVNPEHLEPVTGSENCKRGLTGQIHAIRMKEKTHCPRGHPYSGSNLYTRPNGNRECRYCIYEGKRLAYWRRKTANAQT